MTNPELTAARAAVPEIEAAETRLQAAKELLSDVPHTEAPDAARARVLDEAASVFLTGAAWPKDVGKRAVKAYADADAVLMERQARQLVVRRAEHALYDAESDHTSDALTHLGKRLATLLSDARTALATVGSVSTAEAAIEAGAGVVEAWSRLRALVQDVSAVREAQWSLLRGPKMPGAPAGGDWRGREWRRAGFGHVRSLRPEEAPEDVRKVMCDVTGRLSLEYLRWLAGREDAYVPASEDEFAADVLSLTTPVVYGDDDRPVDMSPMVLPAREYRPSAVYEHSTPPQMDYAAPKSPAPMPNATPGDPAPPTYF
ncbi:hypothetical protein [Streptomyces sp. NPDC002491]